MNAELDAFASALRHHVALTQLRCYLETAWDLYRWGVDEAESHIMLESIDATSGWFTTRYLQPLEQARQLAGDPSWWELAVERCLTKGVESHPSVDVKRKTFIDGYHQCKDIEHAELAQQVVAFYSTISQAIDERYSDATRWWPRLEASREAVLQFITAQRGAE